MRSGVGAPHPGVRKRQALTLPQVRYCRARGGEAMRGSACSGARGARAVCEFGAAAHRKERVKVAGLE